jgi:ElaB/YqjD/DUF883 family membrane-anchored ribosome-binding protein
MNSDQTYRSGGASVGSSRSSAQSKDSDTGMQNVRAKAGETVSKFAEVAQEAGNQAKQAAASLASEANEKAKGFLNQQVGAGADFVRNVAEAARRAADHLAQDSPQAAGLVRNMADKAEDFSRDLRGQSIEDIVGAASDFTRRQPALVFGMASLAGFFLARVLKAGAPPRDSFERASLRGSSYGGGEDQADFSSRSSDQRYGTGGSQGSTSQFHGA